MSNSRPVMVASHPRSGTHLLIDTLRKNFLSTHSWKLPGEPTNRLYYNLDMFVRLSRRQICSEELGKTIIQRPRRVIIKTHFLRDFSATLEGTRMGELPKYALPYIDKALVIFVKRDPAASIDSLRKMLAYTYPAIREITLKDFAIRPFYEDGQSPLERWCAYISGYLNDERVTVIEYDDLLRRPESTIQHLSRLLDEPSRNRGLPRKPSGIWRARMERATQIGPESTAVLAKRWMRGQGVPEATEEEREYIRSEADEWL